MKQGNGLMWSILAGCIAISLIWTVWLPTYSTDSNFNSSEDLATEHTSQPQPFTDELLVNEPATIPLQEYEDKEEERVTTKLKLKGSYTEPLYHQVEAPSSKVKESIGKNKIAYLTFDDGPSRNTERILQILNENDVKATFFVTGRAAEKHLMSLKHIVQLGHTLGNHSYSHDYQRIYASVEAFKTDADKLGRFLHDKVGIEPKLIRFPGGSNNRLSWRAGGRSVMNAITREMSKNGYQYFDWNVSSTDAAAVVQPKEEIINAVKGNSTGKNRIIVLMHDMDVKTTTVEALPEVIVHLKQQGYQFEVLSKHSFTYQFLKL
ncbi:polysaccharide deacetylase family protein [Paenibacillus sp. UNC451MF]|uniref:polysaccharide deacetylase family protein n=1 Tax=Paenibacillus sp. UNC451MF TaxID=1449063 RepID=UPI00068A8C2F|nr:polysaccharide deacetylase family protein [Paenibacillus sp. UNC451MF]